MDQEIYPGENSQEEDRMPGGSPPPTPDKSVEQDRMPGASAGPSFLGRLKSQKWLVFALMGLLGGAAGAFFAELAPGAADNAKFAEVAVKTGIWAAMAACLLATALFWANDIYNRHRFGPKSAQRGILTGGIGGFLAGCVAEGLFQKLQSDDMGDATLYIVYSGCWAVLGLLLGFSFSRSVPNLSIWRGILAGVVGGAIGGFGFVSLSGIEMFPDMVARMVGIGTLGFALGLAIVVIEAVFREASLEVVWAPNENTFFNLGAEPIYIGGGDDDQVYVRGLAPRFSHIVFSDGAVEYVETESQKRTPLRNESSLQIGTLKLVVHAAK